MRNRLKLAALICFCLSFNYSKAQSVDSITTEYSRDGGEWTYQNLTVNTYNNNCLVDSSVYYGWNVFSNSLTPISKTFFTYDEEGREIEQFLQAWIKIPGIWRNSSRYTTQYIDKNHSVSTSQSWSDTYWLNNWRTSNEFNDYGDETYYEFEWAVNGAWEKAGRGITTYNDQNKIASFEYDGYYNNQFEQQYI